MGAAAVLFDLDGVIIDSRQTTLRALATVATARLGRPVAPADLEQYVSHPPPDVFEALGLAAPDEAYDVDFDGAFTAALPAVAVFDAVVAGIRELAGNGTKVGVVTRQSQRRVAMLIPAELTGYLDVVIAHEQAKPKPAPDGILLALDLVGVPASRALFVGDTLTDVLAARRAGVRSALVAWGFTPAPELLACGADLVLASPAEIGPGLLRILAPELEPAHDPADAAG